MHAFPRAIVHAARFLMFRLFHLICCTSLTVSCLAQVDTTLYLGEVEISGSPLRRDLPATLSWSPDATQIRWPLLGDLSQALEGNGPWLVRHYGPGSSATLSIQGGAAGHTAVLWNGMPLNSPMLGLSDLSTIPAEAVQSIQLQSGSSGALWGSGAINGSLHLNNAPEFGSRWQVKASLQAGSWRHFQQFVQLQKGGSKFFTRSAFWHRQATNDFRYQHPYLAGRPVLRQTHAAYSTEGWFHQSYLNLGRRHQLAALAWINQSDRLLPPTLTEQQSRSAQQDQNVRLMASWRWAPKWGIIQTRIASLDESIDFQDSTTSIFTINRAHTWLAESEIQKSWSLGKFQSGLQASRLKGSSQNYVPDAAVQDRMAWFGNWNGRAAAGKLEYQISFRKEWVQLMKTQPVVLTGVSWKPHEKTQLSLQAGNSFRLPTLNDLFWQPGGNSDLLPEQSWGTSTQWQQILLQNERMKVNTELSAFLRKVKNWILWQPGSQFWSPENVATVHNFGGSGAIDIHRQWGKNLFTYRIQANWTQAKNELKHQLPYVPVFNGYQQICFENSRWQLRLRHRFSGKMFTTSDESRHLPGYQLGDFLAAWQLPQKTGTLYAQLDNIWNSHYMITANRPMPLRQWQIGWRGFVSF